jgi:hypothetical protein
METFEPPSNTKKWILIGVPIALLAVAGGAWFSLSPKQAEFHQSLPSSDGLLSISNADNANLTILTAQIDTIIVDLQGPADQVGKARFYSEKPPNSKFDLPDDWGGLSGTITVPTGTLVELKPSKNTPVIITDKKGERPASSGKPLLVDTTHVTKITTGKSGIGFQGGGVVAVEDETLHGTSDQWGDAGIGEGSTSCTYGAQILRDRCCVRLKEGTSVPQCAGAWTYNSSNRTCEFQCDLETPPDVNPGGQNGGGGSNSGNDGLNGADVGINPNPGAKPEDPTSAQCINYSGEARSTCCDERLRNSLRIGPRPGFPDCLGRWRFDPYTLNCKFQCADYGQMLDILNELKLNNPGE